MENADFAKQKRAPSTRPARRTLEHHGLWPAVRVCAMLAPPGSLQRVPPWGRRNARESSALPDSTMTNSTKQPQGCRVVTRYHSGGEMVYELETADASLEVRISSRAVAGGERSWHVAAQPGNAPDSAAISDEAQTKRGALDKVAAQWSEQAAELGLPTFDWTAVATALLAVRGI